MAVGFEVFVEPVAFLGKYSSRQQNSAWELVASGGAQLVSAESAGFVFAFVLTTLCS